LEKKTVKPSLLSTTREIYKSDGIRGFSRGLGTTLCRELPAFACYFGSYDYILKLCSYHPRDDLATAKILFSGGMAGVNSWILTYPIDQVKSKLQADIKGEFESPKDCIRKVWAREGVHGFYRGLSTCVVRGFAVNAATFGGVAVSSNFIIEQLK